MLLEVEVLGTSTLFQLANRQQVLIQTLDAVFLDQKSNCALIFASRAAMIDAGFKYVGP